MGMTIDEAITILGMVEAHGICIEAKDIAVDTMRKYQQVQEIIKSEMSYDSPNMNPNNLSGLLRALEIFREVENGDDD